MKRLKTGDKILIAVTSVVLLFSLFIMSPLSNRYISLAVMSVYSAVCAKDGLPQTEGIDLKIPGGGVFSKGWYPFVVTFVPGEDFGYSIGRDCTLTILYNVADFDPLKGCSRLFDESSPYYSSFYGAYLVKTGDGAAYGFEYGEDGKITGIDLNEVADVARYDYQNLVLSGFGLTKENAVFSFTKSGSDSGLSYAGSDGWYRVDADMTVNGCGHNRSGFTQSYIAYGSPKNRVEEPLKPVKMYGRMYGKYLEDKQVSVFFYIIAADKDLLEECDREILSKSKLGYRG